MNNIIILNDEYGNDITFEFLDLIEYENNEYVILYPVDEDDGEVVILRLEDNDDDTESYLSVEDESTLNSVFHVFKEKNKDIYHFK